MTVTMLKRPSALVPLAMSLAALVLVLSAVAIYGVPGTNGVPPETDEGTAAHVFQLLIAGQLPVIGFFALKWLPQSPREAIEVLALQAAAGVVALFPVFYFGL
jgi:hypothetical protein